VSKFFCLRSGVIEMIENEKTMQFLEEHIPDLADAAFTQAYWQALASGSSVLKVEDGAIIEVFPDGSRKWVKQIPPLIPVAIGKKRMLK
jgi:hypothetical protein